jgi:hypothetical protein
MKITYFAILLAATILSRDVVAQEETPSRSLSTNSRIEKSEVSVRQPTTDLGKKPTYRFQPDTTLKPPPYRPRPDTTSRITPTPAPDTPFDPFSGRGPRPAGSNSRTYTFANGVRVERLGDYVEFTDVEGHRVLMSMQHGAKPPVNGPQICGKLRHWLSAHGNSAKWREECLWYFDNCI